MDQRYRAVIKVENGCPVPEVAARGVSRQTADAWEPLPARRLASLTDHSCVVSVP